MIGGSCCITPSGSSASCCLAEASLLERPGCNASRFVGLRDIEEAWLGGLVVPFNRPASEGRGALLAEAMDDVPIDGRLVLLGGTIDFRGPGPEGVPVRLAATDVAVELSCLVGDLLGDFSYVSEERLHLWTFHSLPVETPLTLVLGWAH